MDPRQTVKTGAAFCPRPIASTGVASAGTRYALTHVSFTASLPVQVERLRLGFPGRVPEGLQPDEDTDSSDAAL